MDPQKYNLTYVELPPSNSALGAGYHFIGPDCLFAGAPSGPIASVDSNGGGSMLQGKTESGKTANVMLYSADPGSGTLTGQTSADATLTIEPKMSSKAAFERDVAVAWSASSDDQGRWQKRGRVEGNVG